MIWHSQVIWYPLANVCNLCTVHNIVLIDCQMSALCVHSHCNAIIFHTWDTLYKTINVLTWDMRGHPVSAKFTYEHTITSMTLLHIHTRPPHSTSKSCQHIPLMAGTEREQKPLTITFLSSLYLQTCPINNTIKHSKLKSLWSYAADFQTNCI